MNFRRWKLNDATAIIGALLAGPLLAGIWLAGCGGGGGGGLNTGGGGTVTPPGSFLVRGTVYAPGRQLKSVSRVVTKQNTLYSPVVAGFTVQIGRVNNAGEGFTVLVQTTTDALGGYTATLPFGVSPNATLVARAINGAVVLENIVTGSVCDISPETTAAVALLFSTAKTRGIAISRIGLAGIINYFNVALPIEQLGHPTTTTASAVSSALAIIQRAPNAQTALNAALNSLGPVGTPVPTQGTPRPTVRPTATTSGGPPGPPGTGTPTPRPTTNPTAVPTLAPTPNGTPFPTPKRTPVPTSTPNTTNTPRPTPVTNPTPVPTAINNPTPVPPTPKPTVVTTPVQPSPVPRRG